MKLDLSKIFELSARTSGAITVACIILLFFPASILPFDISDFRSSNGIWIFVIFVVAITIWFSYLMKWLAQFIKDKVETMKLWDSYKCILENLSDGEKLFLKKYYEKRETAILIDLKNTVHKKLQTFHVISMSAGTVLGSVSGVPGFIQPWVFKLIDKQPKYIEVKCKKEEQNNDQ